MTRRDCLRRGWEYCPPADQPWYIATLTHALSPTNINSYRISASLAAELGKHRHDIDAGQQMAARQSGGGIKDARPRLRMAAQLPERQGPEVRGSGVQGIKNPLSGRVATIVKWARCVMHHGAATQLGRELDHTIVCC